MLVLPDTSAWIEYIRGSDRLADLGQYIKEKNVLVCGPVLAELYAGSNAKTRSELDETVARFPYVNLNHSSWITVGVTAAELRDRGDTTPMVDIAVAVVAAEQGAQLWATNGDFARIKGVLTKLDLRLF